MRAILFFLLWFSTFPAFAQLEYSAADLKAIQKKRFEERIALQKTDRQLHYTIAVFFDKIYHKYRDTSMSAAIRNYTKSTETEGDLMDKESLLAAFRLGQIYESGIGTDTGHARAMFYYLLSGEKGAANLKKLAGRICSAPRVLYATADSVAIAFSPFCVKDRQSFSFLMPMVERMKDKPGKIIYFSILYPRGDIHTSYYNYYNQIEAPRRIRDVIARYLEPFISPDRLNYHVHSEPYGGHEHLMIFIITGIPR